MSAITAGWYKYICQTRDARREPSREERNDEVSRTRPQQTPQHDASLLSLSLSHSHSVGFTSFAKYCLPLSTDQQIIHHNYRPSPAVLKTDSVSRVCVLA